LARQSQFIDPLPNMYAAKLFMDGLVPEENTSVIENME